MIILEVITLDLKNTKYEQILNLLVGFSHFSHSFFIFSDVEFGAHQNYWNIRAMVGNFGVPFPDHVFVRCCWHQGETYDKDVCLWVGEGA